MSSVIVQALPNLTLEPPPMGSAAMRPQGLVPQGWCKGKPWSSWVPALSQRNVQSDKLGVCSILAFPCCLLVLSWQCSSRSLSFLTLPCTHCQGQTLLWGLEPAGERDPGARLGQAGQEHEYGNAPGHAATGLGPCTVRDVLSSHLQLCFPEGAAFRAGLFVSSPSSGQAELLLSLQWSWALLVLCVFKVCILEDLWPSLRSSTHSSSPASFSSSLCRSREY